MWIHLKRKLYLLHLILLFFHKLKAKEAFSKEPKAKILTWTNYSFIYIKLTSKLINQTFDNY